MLGGYGNFGSGATSSKTYEDVPKSVITIEFDYYYLDSWDGEIGWLNINGSRVWQ
jgi:hypothetical protein